MLRDDYIKFRASASNDEKADALFCSSRGYNLDELKEMLLNDQDLRRDILKSRRGQYAERMRAIDEALFKAAECGDTKAADLLYRRFDHWNPKIIEETNNYYNFADLVKGLRPKHVKTVTREL